MFPMESPPASSTPIRVAVVEDDLAFQAALYGKGVQVIIEDNGQGFDVGAAVAEATGQGSEEPAAPCAGDSGRGELGIRAGGHAIHAVAAAPTQGGR